MRGGRVRSAGFSRSGSRKLPKPGDKEDEDGTVGRGEAERHCPGAPIPENVH